jgi:hypothetical protein
MANKDAPLTVEVPTSDRDKPGWVKVGVIAAVGFLVGVAWPRVLGVRLGPSAPGESSAATAASGAQAGRAPDAPPASAVASAAPPLAMPSASAPSAAATTTTASTRSNATPTITVGKGAVLSCKTSDGETKKGSKECGGLSALDNVVAPRIRQIATCAGAEGQSGKLSVIVHADFSSKKVSYDIGKSSTIQNPDAIASCLKTTFEGATTPSAPHEHPRYTVAYTAHLTPGGGKDADKAADMKRDKPASDDGDKDNIEKNAKQASEKEDKPSDTPALASGEALVGWEVALVREAPRTGKLVSRLPRGTRVKIASSKDGWYLIKFGEGYAHEGWVYRGAIGR